MNVKGKKLSIFLILFLIFTVAVLAQASGSTVYYQEDFESSDGGYTHGGSNVDWQWGSPVSWPGAAASGDHCWGTNLNGNYSHNTNQYLLSPEIDLSAIPSGTPLSLQWMQAWHIESATWDQAYAEYRINGGDWQTLWQHSGGTTQNDWQLFTRDISSAAGETVQFRWRMTSDFSVSYSGLYIDDVMITGAGNDLPVAHPSSFVVAEGGTFQGAVSGSDPDGGPLTFALVTGPAYGTLVFNAGGEFSYTAHRQPTQGFEGSDAFSFTAYDGESHSEPAEVSITITPVNDAPVATPKAFTVTEGMTYSGAVEGTDIDGDALTFSLVTGPAHGSLTFNGDGTFDYTAAVGYTGSDSFTFRAYDGLAQSAPAEVAVTIESGSPLPSAPYATGVHITGTARVGETLVGSYTYNPSSGGDPEEGTSFRWLWAGTESTLFNNWNIGGVTHNPAGPPNPTVFTLTDPHIVTYVNTYHWDNSLPVGSISLLHEDGTVYGPWDAVGRDGSGRTNVVWQVYPNELLKPGTYTVVDSGPSTWSHNSTSNNRGFSDVKGYMEDPIPGANAQTYQLTAGDEGKRVAFEVTVRDQNQNAGNPVVSPETDDVEGPLPVPVEGISLNVTELNLTAGGEAATLVAAVEPAEATNKGVVWSSSDESVATVQAQSPAVVTPVGEGTAVITARSTENEEIYALCTVTVTAVPVVVPVTGVTLNIEELTLTVDGAAATLVAAVEPAEATNKGVIWSSSDESVATVQAQSPAVVTPVGEGTAVITVMTVDGEFAAVCAVTVLPADPGEEEEEEEEQELPPTGGYLYYGIGLLAWAGGITILRRRK